MYLNETKMAKLAINKSLLKEYQNEGLQRVVYMQDNDEFQIQIFNPETKPIGVKISINGESFPNYLIIKPGERIWLERYIDKSVKFKFSTYEVENTLEVKNAIADNGDVKIEFFREKSRTVYPYYTYTGDTLLNHNNYTIKDFSTVYCDSVNSTATANYLDNQNLLKSTAALFSNESGDATLDTKCAIDTFNNSTITNKTFTSKTLNCKTSQNNTLETGRISEGGYSNQSFTYTNLNLETWPFATENIKILPLSRKPYNSNDLKKIYCTNCGHKLNTKFKYCPYCGTKMQY